MKHLVTIRVPLFVASICMTSFVHGDSSLPNSVASPVPAQTECNSKYLKADSSVHAKDIVGMYRHSVNLPPHSAFPSEERPSGYNYLAITLTGNNQLRVRLITKEVNGHQCGLDNSALLCGRSIQIIPREDEKAVLESLKQPAPQLNVTKNQILFTQKLDGNYVWGSPYCGALGGLSHSFKRATRNQKIDNSVFNQ
ncbi:MAG: hypothetical protein HYX42_16620 [Polaromonas sp.]|uniref:hypothetical protein n=1 Tax=Polaromonas sp. TaxID=1869339 RepID=UPI0025FF10A6|nr:hypothetical protein [Polaromonas sp.]MBI2727868.1 hypothetical protein [Polaromonas sp.]